MKDMKLRVISMNDISALFKGRTDQLFGVVEDSFRKWDRGDVALPAKISQIFDKSTQNRINCMPATLFSDKVCGMKWVSVFPSNAPKNIQNVTGVILLSEIKTGFPVAIMDGTLLTSLRTAAVGCVAAKYLAPSLVETVGFIGGGQEARMHFALLKHLFPTIKECRVSSRTKATERDFIQSFADIMEDVKFVACDGNAEKAAINTDIVVTAISGQAPVLKAKSITKGGLYIHVGGWEDEFAVVKKATKIVCDDWESCKHRTQTISRMYLEGLLNDTDIYANLAELVEKRKIGRSNDDEFIYFNSVGLSFIDVNLAYETYKLAVENNLGTFCSLSENFVLNYSDFL